MSKALGKTLKVVGKATKSAVHKVLQDNSSKEVKRSAEVIVDVNKLPGAQVPVSPDQANGNKGVSPLSPGEDKKHVLPSTEQLRKKKEASRGSGGGTRSRRTATRRRSNDGDMTMTWSRNPTQSSDERRRDHHKSSSGSSGRRRRDGDGGHRTHHRSTRDRDRDRDRDRPRRERSRSQKRSTTRRRSSLGNPGEVRSPKSRAPRRKRSPHPKGGERHRSTTSSTKRSSSITMEEPGMTFTWSREPAVSAPIESPKSPPSSARDAARDRSRKERRRLKKDGTTSSRRGARPRAPQLEMEFIWRRES